MERHFSLESFGKFLEAQAMRHPEVLGMATKGSAGILYRNAYGTFGNSSKLEDLAPSTQDERERLGFTPNDPLLRNGELLRASLEEHHDIMFAAIGSAEPVMLYHEFGNGHFPPRPVFKIALEDSMLEVVDVMNMAFQTALGVHKVQATLLKDLNSVTSDREIASMASQFEVFNGPSFGSFSEME